MTCAHFTFLPPETPAGQWTPPALRDTECLLRKSNPEKWTETLISMGIEASMDDCSCLRNLDGDWEQCPLFVPRGGRKKREEISIMPGLI